MLTGWDAPAKPSNRIAKPIRDASDTVRQGLAVVRLMMRSNRGWAFKIKYHIGYLCPAHNLVDKPGSAQEQIQKVRSVGHQPARLRRTPDAPNAKGLMRKLGGRPLIKRPPH